MLLDGFAVEKGCARERDDEIWQRAFKRNDDAHAQGNEGEI
jgi:hypothetical protein